MAGRYAVASRTARDPLSPSGRNLAGCDHPYWSVAEEPSRPQSLFRIQDVFIDPRKQKADPGGHVAFLDENQGVWGFGYHDDCPQQLFVKGDWLTSAGTQDWRPIQGSTVEQAVITVLLSNLFWMTMDDFRTTRGSRDDALDLCLWSMPDWGFDGFWTNNAGSRLYYTWHELCVSRRAS